jgi:GPH family glycoside/pentoside/hexuronide:cation symporter
VAYGVGAADSLGSAPSDTNPPLGRGGIAAYAAGSLGTGVFSTVPTVLLLYFCTEVLTIPAKWATGIVFIPKIWSIVWDPFVGSWSDRTTSRLGRRRPFLVVGMLGVAICFVALFSPPFLGANLLALWMAAAYFALATLYSLFAVPYIGIPAEVGRTAKERSDLVASRMFIAMVGVVLGAGGVPLLVHFFGGGRTGYATTSRWLAVICLAAMSMPLLLLRGRDLPRTAFTVPFVFCEPMRSFRNLRFRYLSVTLLLQTTAVAVVTSAAPYLVTKCFARGEGSIGVALLAMLTATILSIPVWAFIGRRFGELRMLKLAVAGFAAFSVVLAWLARVNAGWSAALAGFAVLGIPFAGMQVLPFTMVTHLIRAECTTGPPVEGSFTGIWTGMEKLGLALGPTTTGSALWLFGGTGSNLLPALVATVPVGLVTVTWVFLTGLQQPTSTNSAAAPV